MERNPRVSVSLEEPLHDWVQQKASQSGMSVSSYLRDLALVAKENEMGPNQLEYDVVSVPQSHSELAKVLSQYGAQGKQLLHMQPQGGQRMTFLLVFARVQKGSLL